MSFRSHISCPLSGFGHARGPAHTSESTSSAYPRVEPESHLAMPHCEQKYPFVKHLFGAPTVVVLG